MRVRANGHHPQAAVKRCWIWFLCLSRFGQIGVCVIAAHTVVILMLLVNHAASREMKARKPIAIRTSLMPQPSAPGAIAAGPSAPVIKGAIAKSAAPAVQEKKPAAPALKKEAAKMSTAPKSIPLKKGAGAAGTKKKEVQAVKETGEIDSALLLQIAENLGAIAASSKVTHPPNFSVSLPNSVEIQSVGVAANDSPAYGETVSAILQNNLDLPEYGEVVAKIDIDASGAVVGCEILETRSRKNAEFLKKRLQELAFPCFNEFGLVEKHLNFTITFHNVENR